MATRSVCMVGLMLGAPCGPVAAQTQVPAASAASSTVTASISEAATRFGVAEDWIRAVMQTESAGNPRAVSPVGAMGLMQIMPATWADLSVRFALGRDPYDVRANILAGAAYLRAMRDRYGDLPSTLAAYNAGPRRVDDWRSLGRQLPGETVAYVTRIAARLSGIGAVSPKRMPAPAPDWRQARLFTVAVNATTDAASSTPGTMASPVPAASPPPHVGSLKATDLGLFVPRSGPSAP